MLHRGEGHGKTLHGGIITSNHLVRITLQLQLFCSCSESHDFNQDCYYTSYHTCIVEWGVASETSSHGNAVLLLPLCSLWQQRAWVWQVQHEEEGVCDS